MVFFLVISLESAARDKDDEEKWKENRKTRLTVVEVATRRAVEKSGERRLAKFFLSETERATSFVNATADEEKRAEPLFIYHRLVYPGGWMDWMASSSVFLSFFFSLTLLPRPDPDERYPMTPLSIDRCQDVYLELHEAWHRCHPCGACASGQGTRDSDTFRLLLLIGSLRVVFVLVLVLYRFEEDFLPPFSLFTVAPGVGRVLLTPLLLTNSSRWISHSILEQFR